MILDLKFFENLIHVFETDTNILRKYQDKLRVTEAWLHISDVLLRQCKEIISVERFNEERNAVFHEMTTFVDDYGMTYEELMDIIASRVTKKNEPEQPI